MLASALTKSGVYFCSLQWPVAGTHWRDSRHRSRCRVRPPCHWNRTQCSQGAEDPTARTGARAAVALGNAPLKGWSRLSGRCKCSRPGIWSLPRKRPSLLRPPGSQKTTVPGLLPSILSSAGPLPKMEVTTRNDCFPFGLVTSRESTPGPTLARSSAPQSLEFLTP